MRSTSITQGRMIAVASLVAASLGTAATPTVASASGLTRRQVITLIRRYSKPGPRGRRGAPGQQGQQGQQGGTGPAGSYQVTAPLTLNGGTLGVSPALFTRCPSTEFVNVLQSAGIGCASPVSAQYGTGGYNSNAAVDAPTASLGSSYGRIANNPTVFDTGGTITAYINATVRVGTNGATPASPSIDQCQLYDTTTSTALLTEDITNGGIGNGDLETIASIGAGDTIELRCEELSNDSDTAEGTIVVIPIDLFS